MAFVSGMITKAQVQCVGTSVVGFSLSEFCLELPDPCFGCHAGFLLRVGSVPFVFERDDVLPGGRVLPPQLSVFPLERGE